MQQYIEPMEAIGLRDENWILLPSEPYVRDYPDKQDDIYFIDRLRGWYGNPIGRLFKTTDGGETWVKQLHKPGTFIRSLAFVNERVGIMGTIGTDTYEGITDSTALYRTEDGGDTWLPVTEFEGSEPAGICGIDVQRYSRIFSARLEHRTTIRAAGRVNGPAHLATSHDLGVSWVSRDMSDHVSMILDVVFLDNKIGFIAGATDGDIEKSSARVIKTTDGGKTWREVYRSARKWEITWKINFPTNKVGYVTIQNYSQDENDSELVMMAKTVDGGETFFEFPVVRDRAVQPLGVAFVDENRGWMGALPYGFRTEDGGRSWARADVGQSVNKFRVIRDTQGIRVYAIGAGIKRLDLPAP